MGWVLLEGGKDGCKCFIRFVTGDPFVWVGEGGLECEGDDTLCMGSEAFKKIAESDVRDCGGDGLGGEAWQHCAEEVGGGDEGKVEAREEA